MIRAPRGAVAAWLAATLLVMARAAPAAAQADAEDAAAGEVPRAELVRAVAEEIVDFFNDPATLRIWGEATIPAGAEIAGDVAVLGGTLTLAGRVEGRVAVINGDARLLPGSRIGGDLTVVGGDVERAGDAVVAGSVVAYAQRLRYNRDGETITYAPFRDDALFSAGRDLGFGRTDFTAGSLQGYNRVEGLPIVFGPRVEFGRANPTRIEALLIHRSETGLRIAPRETGYRLQIEQALGGRNRFRAGVTLHSEIVPIEDWSLTRTEASLATFVLHQDYRDHYERVGHSAYFSFGGSSRPVALTLEYRDERHHIVAVRGPWALFGNDREWRPQPAISGGELRSLQARFRYDTRNATGDASTGWLVNATVEKGLGGTLTDPVVLDTPSGEPEFGDVPANSRFVAAFFDVRRYERLGPDSRLALRAVVAGSIDGKSLPSQRQHALGGEGSLPGYDLFAFDCGARRHTLDFPSNRFHPYYGCDRLLLMQLEYEVRLPFATGIAQRFGWPFDIVDAPVGVLFVNAGRAWNEPGDLRGRRRGQDAFAADGGFGIRLGPVGLHWALPFSGGGVDGVNFFVRLNSRL